MVRNDATAALASAQAGYESPSQLSRELKRPFGRAPIASVFVSRTDSPSEAPGGDAVEARRILADGQGGCVSLNAIHVGCVAGAMRTRRDLLLHVSAPVRRTPAPASCGHLAAKPRKGVAPQAMRGMAAWGPFPCTKTTTCATFLAMPVVLLRCWLVRVECKRPVEPL